MHFIRTMPAMALAALLAACGGGGGSDDETSPSTPRTPVTTIAQALAAAEASGAYPVLNRDDTVAGPDADGNGVRDDLDAYIAALTDTDVQKHALRQSASAIRSALQVDTTDQNALVGALQQIASASACLHARYSAAAASDKSADLEKLTVNTQQRFKAYAAFSTAASGHSFVLPQGDGCVE